MRFCTECSGRLELRPVSHDPKPRHVCRDCRRVHYEDPKIAACTIPIQDGRVLLLRRAIEPRRGFWVFPGGYMDRGETVEAAAVRETWEEANLHVAAQELLNVYSYEDSIVVVVVYLAEVLSGELRPGPECMEAGWFGPEAIPWEQLAFQSTRAALKDCLSRF